MSREPGLAFWLRYAEREGALLEGDDAKALLVLPAQLQERFGLAEEVAVTSDPEIARDEGALLLIPGHPVLDAAAAAVLEDGDAGTSWLSWPRKPPPTTAWLVAAARDQVGVEHGRLDSAADARLRYAPILHIGVQVTYLVQDRFLEREDVWVDGCTGLPLPDPLVRAAVAAPRLDGRAEHAVLDPDLERAVASADRLLAERASRRLTVLARQSAAGQAEELNRAEAYFAAALESIAERRREAAPDRQRLLDAQAGAVAAERERRLQEIRDTFEPRFEIRPVRLHCWWVPALHLPVRVRRGERSFPFALTWWPAIAAFAATSCPGCGSGARLVAARDRLGCRSCVEPAATAPVRPAGTAPPPATLAQAATAPADPMPPGPSTPAPARAGLRPAAVGPVPGRTGGSRGPGAAPPSEGIALADLEAVRRAREHFAELDAWNARVSRTGDQLAGALWTAVITHDRWPRKRADPHSPLQVVVGLYGPEGPLRALGIPVGTRLEESRAATLPAIPGFLHATSGVLLADGLPYPFTIRWRTVAGKPAVEEVLPYATDPDGTFRSREVSIGVRTALRVGAPPPRVALDPVGEALWLRELPQSGLPLVVRCLAAWGRVAPDPETPRAEPAVLAAALGALMGRRAGLPRTREAAAADHGVDPGDVLAVARGLQRVLRLAPERPW